MGVGLNVEYEYAGLYNAKPVLETFAGLEQSDVSEAGGAIVDESAKRTFTASIGGAYYGLKQIFRQRLADGSFRPQDVAVVNIGHDLIDAKVQ